jgi:hypothetical protein
MGAYIIGMWKRCDLGIGERERERERERGRGREHVAW